MRPDRQPRSHCKHQYVDEISLLEVWRTLLRHRTVILVTTLAGIAATVAVALLASPIYRVEALLAPAADDEREGLSALAGQFGGLAALAGVDLSNNAQDTDEAIALLKSRALTG